MIYLSRNGTENIEAAWELLQGDPEQIAAFRLDGDRPLNLKNRLSIDAMTATIRLLAERVHEIDSRGCGPCVMTTRLT
jgi:hypothetical protein